MKILGARYYASVARGYDTAPRVFEGQWSGRYLVRNRNRDGNLYVRYLYWNDGRWNWSNNWLDNDWNDGHPAALRATLLISHPTYAWG